VKQVLAKHASSAISPIHQSTAQVSIAIQ